MYAVMGATGHVGSAVANYLLERGEKVLAIVRERKRAEKLSAAGADVVEVDVHDVAGLRNVFQRCRRAFLLNPPADISTDTDTEERKTVRCILQAFEGSRLEFAVAESTYGAHPGERCGDLNVLYELEQGLQNQPIPVVIQRAAYYMSNWDAFLVPARESGKLPTLFPADFVIPMVDPEDLGRNAGRLLMQDEVRNHTIYMEGPQRYSPNDVARAFSKALGREVEPAVVPERRWHGTFRELGFSEDAASSYSKMTKATLESTFEIPGRPLRGSISLEAHISRLVAAPNLQRKVTS